MVELERPCPSCGTEVSAGLLSCPSCGALSLPPTSVGAAAGIAPRLAGALAHRYRIERELGQGGMAVVFLALDLRHDRRVAIKVLQPELSQFLGAERFLREIRFAAQLNHPHIVPLHDSGEADGLLFYVMPYVEGDSLRRRLTRDHLLPVGEAVRIAAEAADGLAYAHGLGVVHRDIKPENILLTHSHAVIADFGIARAVHAMGTGSAITTQGISLGTPHYMSPEQTAADPTLDHRTDIYALGCTLYEALTGQPPYPGPSAMALAAQHLTSPVPVPSTLRKEVPAALDAAVRRAMAKAPTDRFQTATEFAAALAPLATPTSSGVTSARWSGAWRWRAIAAAVVVVAGAVVLLRRQGSGAAAPDPRPPVMRVVVRPFEDRTGSQRLAATVVTETLTDLLSVPALNVTASAVVAELRDAPLDTLRARFAPDRIVIGRIEATGDSLRVTAQIVDSKSGASLAESSLVVSHPAAAAGDAAKPLSLFVRHEFWNEMEREERRGQVHDLVAWTLVERARELAAEARAAVVGRQDGQGFQWLRVSDSLLEVAQKMDRESALIPLDLARNAEQRAFSTEYLAQVLRNPPAGLPRPAMERGRARALLDQLIRSGRGGAGAFELRGNVQEGLYRELHADSLLDGAIADFTSATALDLHRATAWRDLGSAQKTAGHYRDALMAFERAFGEDDFQFYRLLLLRYQFDAALLAADDGKAEEACRTGMSEAPRDPLFNDCELQLWSRTGGNRRSAAAARERADSLALNDPNPLGVPLRELWIAAILAHAGLGDSADHVAQRTAANLPAEWRPQLLPELAYLRLLRKDADSAMALIATGVRLDPTLRQYFLSAPWFEPLRSDARFAATVWKAATPP